jgi:hypothetical protein
MSSDPTGAQLQGQSIRPPLALVVAGIVVLLLFGIIWATVTVAIDHGGQSCPSRVHSAGEHEARCR